MTNLPASSTTSDAVLRAALQERARREPESAAAWAESERTFLGRPMLIPAPLRPIYDDQHPFIVVQKPAQVGMTECNVNVALHAALTVRGGRGHVGYFMPTQENADRVSQDRFARAIRESTQLRRLGTEVPAGERGPQRVQMRQIGHGLIYLTGSEETSQFTGLDLDLAILDEFDLMKRDILAEILGRLRSSRQGQTRIASTPTVPGFGVNALIEESDDHHYELCCRDCGTWIEPSYPSNVNFERMTVACGCGADLPWTLPGRWVARHPERPHIRGYQLNRLTLPNPPLRALQLASSLTVGMSNEQFWRLDLGLPYVSSESRLTGFDLDKCRAEAPPPALLMKPDAVVMGVDVGVRSFWVVIRAFIKKRSFPLFIGRVDGEWSEVAKLARKHHVRWCAVDALPDTRGATALQRELRNESIYTFICYYNRQQAHDYTWEAATINAARTLSLDETFDAFRRERHLLPEDARSLADGAYYEHMQALVRTTEADPFGQPIPTYVHTRPDDFAHAENYVTLIATRWGRWNGWWD